MSKPRLTAVIPCHNHARWVNDAIDSVLAQDRPVNKVVVVDDGSTDGSGLEVFSRLELAATSAEPLGGPDTHRGFRPGSDVQITLLQVTKPGGPSAARNLAVRHAWDETDAFLFLDSDDLYEQGKVRRSVGRWLDAPEHVGMVYSDYDTLNEATGLRVRQYKEPYSRERLVRECLPNCDSLVSKAALELVGPFDESLRCCEDYDLWLRMSERLLLVHLPEPLLTIRVGGHSSTDTVARETWAACHRRVFEKAARRAAGGT